MDTDRFLSRAEAADYLTTLGLRIAKQTLAKMAVTSGGPEYQTFGSRVVYRSSKLSEWANSRLSAPRRSTSEAA
jgi:hypothetical protein